MTIASRNEPHEGTTLASLLREQALAQPDAPAILAPGREALSHAALRLHAEMIGRRLRAVGVAPSTRVGVVLPHGPEMATAFLGVAAHAACVPLNPACNVNELRFHLQDTRCAFVLLQRGESIAAREAARGLGLGLIEIEVDLRAPAGRFDFSAPAGPGQATADVHTAGADTADDAMAGTARFNAPHDIALLLHTSGTTARPKLVPLSNAQLVASARNIAAHLSLRPTDRGLNVMPLFHIHGLVGSLLAALAGGGSVVCAPGFDDGRFFDWVAQFEPSWFTAVPTMHQALLAQAPAYRRKAPAHRFRFVRSSSAALPAATLRALAALFDAPVVEAYGMTEAAHQMASNPAQRGEQTPGSVGSPAGAEIAILDAAGQHLGTGQVGEVAVRGPGVMHGYENNPQANAEAFHGGWFRTGDMGHLDTSGRLFIDGRLKEIVNRGGEKISPREVDEALLDHPDVAQACAFGVPHPTLGEDLAAAVVCRAGSTATEADLRAHLFARLAGHKVPSQIVLVHAIPAGATGKVQRTSLFQALAAVLTRAHLAPATADERALEVIFREVLACGPLGVHDNFFAMGGDSLRGARVMARVNQRFGLNLPAIGLFRHPSVAELAAQVAAARAQAAADDAALAAEIEALSDEEVARLLAEAEDPSVAASTTAFARNPNPLNPPESPPAGRT